MIGALPYASSLDAARLASSVSSRAIRPRLNLFQSASSAAAAASSPSEPAIIAGPAYAIGADAPSTSSRLPLIAGVALVGVAAVVVVLKLKKRK